MSTRKGDPVAEADPAATEQTAPPHVANNEVTVRVEVVRESGWPYGRVLHPFGSILPAVSKLSAEGAEKAEPPFVKILPAK